jgi:inorganic pyrophosphatase
MPNLAKLPTWAGDDLVVVVETPRGARAKLNFDPELRAFVLSKALMLGLSYPYDWGFIPSTRAEDGDPLDVMVIHDAATYPGLIMRCKLIGVLQTLQQNTQRPRHRGSREFASRAGIAWP